MAKRGSIPVLQWKVEARYRIQCSLLVLMSLAWRNPRALANRALMLLFLSAVGAAFSLWRAAFLISDRRRTQCDAFRDVDELLVKLLEDNVVSFATDRHTEAWTCGYYLKNAKYRLDNLTAGLDDLLRRLASVTRRAGQETDSLIATRLAALSRWYVEIAPAPGGSRQSDLVLDPRYAERLRRVAVAVSRGTSANLVSEEFYALQPHSVATDEQPMRAWSILHETLDEVVLALAMVAIEIGEESVPLESQVARTAKSRMRRFEAKRSRRSRSRTRQVA